MKTENEIKETMLKIKEVMVIFRVDSGNEEMLAKLKLINSVLTWVLMVKKKAPIGGS